MGNNIKNLLLSAKKKVKNYTDQKKKSQNIMEIAISYPGLIHGDLNRLSFSPFFFLFFFLTSNGNIKRSKIPYKVITNY